MASGCQTKSGGRCPKPALAGLPYCGLHQPDPELRRQFIAAQGRAGGDAKAAAVEKRAEERRRGWALPPAVPRDPVAFLERYLPHPLSPAWRAVVRAIYGLALDDADRKVLDQIAGHTKPSPAGYTDACAIVGRRGGKSEVTAGLGLFEALVTDHMAFIAQGQRAHFFIVSRTIKQSTQVFRYARQMVERNEELSALLECEPTESNNAGGELKFINGASLSCFAAIKASARGFTVLGAVFDEFAWLNPDEDSANQDEEVVTAVRYGAAPPEGAPPRRMLVISSPAAKRGLVWDLWSQHYGRPDAPVLVVQGNTKAFNPSISEKWLAAEQKRDPKAYLREIEAQFADAISAWIDRAAVEQATLNRTADPLHSVNDTYFAAVDIGFKRDRSVLVIAHVEKVPFEHLREQEAVIVRADDLTGQSVPMRRTWEPKLRFVVDGVWVWTPTPDAPLDAPKLVAAIADIVFPYGIREIHADQYSIVPLQGEFKRHQITLTELTWSSQSKLEAFNSLRESFYDSRVSLPNMPIIVEELTQLQEKISGNVVRFAAPGKQHDDVAHAIAACHLHAMTRPAFRCGTSPADFMDW